MLNITLKDGTVLAVEEGTNCYDVAKRISPGLARAALGASIDGQRCDLSTPLTKDCSLGI